MFEGYGRANGASGVGGYGTICVEGEGRDNGPSGVEGYGTIRVEGCWRGSSRPAIMHNQNPIQQ